MKIIIRPEDHRDPHDSQNILCRIEEAPGCEGAVCGTDASGEHGKSVSTISHDHHLVISGINPLASPRYFAVSK